MRERKTGGIVSGQGAVACESDIFMQRDECGRVAHCEYSEVSFG